MVKRYEKVRSNKKFAYIKNRIPADVIDEAEGYYVTNDLSIEKQVKNLKEGHGKIFFFKISKNKDGDVNLELVSENVYISPTKYV
jgi:hypothetical protein